MPKNAQHDDLLLAHLIDQLEMIFDCHDPPEILELFPGEGRGPSLPARHEGW